MPKIIDAAPQTTTPSWTYLDGSFLYAPGAGLFSYIIKCTVAQSKYRVIASHKEDFSTYIIDEAETIIDVDEISPVAGPAFYRYYKVQIQEVTTGGKIECTGDVK